MEQQNKQTKIDGERGSTVNKQLKTLTSINMD